MRNHISDADSVRIIIEILIKFVLVFFLENAKMDILEQTVHLNVHTTHMEKPDKCFATVQKLPVILQKAVQRMIVVL